MNKMAASAAKGKKRKGHLTESKVGYLMILPNYIIYTVFTLIPIIWTVVLSFTDYDLKTGQLRRYFKLYQHL